MQPTKTFYKDYLALNSQYIFIGYNPSIKERYLLQHTPYLALVSLPAFTPYTNAWGLWGQTQANNPFWQLVLFLTHLVVVLTTRQNGGMEASTWPI